MALRINGKVVDGMRIAGKIAGGVRIGGEVTSFAAVAPVDQPGTLNVSAVAGGRRNAGAVVTARLTDPDGIRSITSTELLARDGQTQAIADTRVDANTYGFTQTYNNARWRTATMTVVYIDGTGATRTLSQAYSV